MLKGSENRAIMSELPENHNAPFITVSELSGAIKRTLEGSFDYVRVRGEISRPSFPASGHVYFTLKDDSHNLGAVIWRGVAAGLDVRPEEGLDVIVTGKITTFSGQSKYQLNVRSIEIAGEGALLKMLEERKKRLEAEGLFAPEKKQAIPSFPRVIGVVTSPTGAVIQDILHRLEDRFGVHVLVWPVLVQGQGSAEQVAEAIAGFNKLDEASSLPRPDLLIIARGGGALEDLMSFNEEIVIRAAAASQIPLISSIGHETDTTLLDYVADRRAPTPTAAAEMATPVLAELKAKMADWQARQFSAMGRVLQSADQALQASARGLIHPVERLNAQAQRLDYAHSQLVRHLEGRLLRAENHLSQMSARLVPPHSQLAKMTRRFDLASSKIAPLTSSIIERQTARLATAQRLLEANSYNKVLARGFALVRNEAGEAVKSAQTLGAGEAVKLVFADGDRGAIIDDGQASVAPKTPPKTKAPKKPKSTKTDGQAELF